MTKSASLLLLLTTIVIAVVSFTTVMILGARLESSSSSCSTSDANLLKLQAIVCNSLSGATPNACCQNPLISNVTANHDWPRQALYMLNLWNALGSPSTCLNTPVAANVVNWLAKNYSSVNVSCTFMNTWEVFQFGYYSMPRKPGDRIESAWTLGMKSWAFALLMENWHPSRLNALLSPYGLSLGEFETQVNDAIPRSFTLSNEVAANCFVNKSFSPSRNGTCPLSIVEFKAGFEFQNVRNGQKLKNPYWLNGK